MDENKPKPKRLIALLGVVIIVGILAIIAFSAIPNYGGGHGTSPMSVCINNLRQIDAAKQQWALENAKTNSDTSVTWKDIRPYMGRDPDEGHGVKNYDPLKYPPLSKIYCPQDKARNCSNSYTLGDLQTKPKCKINPATHKLD